MSRPLNVDTEAALGNDRVGLAGILYIGYPAPDEIRVWTGSGTLAWDSQSWIGVGSYGSAEVMEETTALEAPTLKFGLSGVSSEGFVADVLNVARVGYPVKAWLAFFDPDALTMIGDPVQLYEGETGAPEIAFDEKTATVTISTDNVEADLDRARNRRYTPEDQKQRAWFDRGFDKVASLQEKEVRFG